MLPPLLPPPSPPPPSPATAVPSATMLAACGVLITIGALLLVAGVALVLAPTALSRRRDPVRTAAAAAVRKARGARAGHQRLSEEPAEADNEPETPSEAPPTAHRPDVDAPGEAVEHAASEAPRATLVEEADDEVARSRRKDEGTELGAV